MKSITKEVYTKLEDGSMKLVETITIELDEPTAEELIADKEAQLLAIYEELQALKNNQ